MLYFLSAPTIISTIAFSWPEKVNREVKFLKQSHSEVTFLNRFIFFTKKTKNKLTVGGFFVPSDPYYTFLYIFNAIIHSLNG